MKFSQDGGGMLSNTLQGLAGCPCVAGYSPCATEKPRPPGRMRIILFPQRDITQWQLNPAADLRLIRGVRNGRISVG